MANWNSPLGVTTFILGLLLSAPSSAGSITWGTPQDISGPGDVNNSESLVEAVNLTNADLVPGETVVNGVTFTHDDTLMGLLGGVGLLAGNTTGDEAYDVLIDSVDHGLSTIADPWVLQVGGDKLSPGETYGIQLWYTDLRSFAGDFTQVYSDGGGNPVTLDAGNGGFGQFVQGTFIADDTTQTLAITGGGPPGEPHLSAYQIRGNPGAPPMDGDADLNGVVNELDLDILLSNFYVTDPKPGLTKGNFNNDLTVDELDFIRWRNAFLSAGGSLAGLNIVFPTAPVPEPSSCVLVVSFFLLWGIFRYR